MLRKDFTFTLNYIQMNRIRANVIVLFSCLLLGACQKKKEISSLDEDVLIPILSDMHIAQEMVLKFRVAERDSVRKKYYYEISQIHKVDTTVITEELKILQANPEYAFEIYESVYKFLDKMSDKNNKKKEK